MVCAKGRRAEARRVLHGLVQIGLAVLLLLFQWQVPGLSGTSRADSSAQAVLEDADETDDRLVAPLGKSLAKIGMAFRASTEKPLQTSSLTRSVESSHEARNPPTSVLVVRAPPPSDFS
ncbi:MAG: hypothetical protein AB1411_02875 [Nitrospirota bacterium]